MCVAATGGWKQFLIYKFEGIEVAFEYGFLYSNICTLSVKS